jgi:hypothetical protein
MQTDRKWVERNLGFDPISTPPPPTTFAFAPAAKAQTAEDFQREIIDFDSESGYAVLGLVAKDLGADAPRWLAIRNVSDPQIKADGLTLKQQAAMAAQIYKGFGRRSSVCSAITCWASISAE